MEILKEMPRRDPLNGTFELTVRCNLKCKMCLFRHDDSENAEIMVKEKNAEEWIDMARQVAEAGTIKLLITGGEPMLRPDFCEIYEEIYKMGFIITLYTNATLVTPKIMDVLKKYPPHKIGVTLYGACEETYKKVCGVSAYEKTISGIQELSKLPSMLEIRSTLIKDNIMDLDSMYKIVEDKFGKDVPFCTSRIVLKPVRGGTCDVESCRLTPKDNVELLFKKTKEVIKDFGLASDDDSIKFKFEDKESSSFRPTIYGCDAGMSSYTITWDGKLIGCQMLDDTWVSPFKDGFNKSWQLFPTKVVYKELNEKCKNCKDKMLCSTCVATRMAETGDISGCPKYICEDVKEMKKYLIL